VAKEKNNSLITGTILLKVADWGLFLSYVGAVIAVYILDIIFFGSLVPLGFLTGVFILIGVVLRTGAVTAGIVLQKLKPLGPRARVARGMIRALWAFCVIACLASAINFFAAGHAEKGKDAIMGSEVAKTTVVSKGARITAIQAEIDAAKAEMDEAVAEVNKSIDAILDDGVPGVSASDNQSLMQLRAEIKEYRDDFKELKAEKEDAIEDIRSEREDAQIEETRSENTADTWQVFIWLGDNIKVANSDGWSTWGLFYFAMLLEAIAAFGLGAYVEIHHFFRRAIADLAIEEDVRLIHHDAELTSARIQAEALRRQLAGRAEREAWRMMREDPEFMAAMSGINWLKEVMGAEEKPEREGEKPEIEDPPPPRPPPPPPPENPKEDWSPQQLNGAKGGEANAFKNTASAAGKHPIGPDPFSGALGAEK
jgi:hypothetical protein